MQDDADLPAKWAMEDSSHLEITNAQAGGLAELDAPLIIYNDRRQAIAKLNKRMMFAVPVVAIYCLSLFAMHLYILGLCFIAYFALIYLFVVRRFNRNVAPLMVIDSTGITIQGLLTHLHLDWENFSEARPYTLLYRFVGINPKSIWKMEASLLTKLLLSYVGLNRVFYSLFGAKAFIINIPEQYSHFKAEEICEQIEMRRKHFLALPDQNSRSQLPNHED